VAQLLEELAKTHDVRERPADAEAALSRAIAIREKEGLENDAELAKDLYSLSRRYLAQRKYAEAEPLARRALSNFEKVGGPDDTPLIYSLTLLASIAQELGHGAEAESLAKRSLAIAEKGPADDNKVRMNCLSLLSYLYSRQGRPDEAQAVDRRRHALTVESFARAGFVEAEDGTFVLSPNATQAQKDAWAAKQPKESRPRPVGVGPVGVPPQPQLPTDGIGGEILGSGSFEFPTVGNVEKPKAVDTSDMFLPPFPSDIDVKKTSGTNPDPVIPPTPPQ
jgi:hypothetical protein